MLFSFTRQWAYLRQGHSVLRLSFCKAFYAAMYVPAPSTQKGYALVNKLVVIYTVSPKDKWV